MSTPLRQIPHNLPTLLATTSSRELLRDMAVLLDLKSLHPDGRFKADRPTLDQHARLTGWQGKTFPGKSLGKCLQRLRALKLTKLHDGCWYLATWPQILQHFNLPCDMRKCYRFPRNDKKMSLIIKQLFWSEEQDRFKAARDAKLKRDYDLQLAAQSVCSNELRQSEIAYGQLKLFCQTRFGATDGDAEYLLLYAKTSKGRFYYKADANISVQHISTRMGYKRKNGFCYTKKLLMDAGYIIATRREEPVQPFIRTNNEQRACTLGTFFRDTRTGQNKLRLTDAVQFINPGTDVLKEGLAIRQAKLKRGAEEREANLRAKNQKNAA